MKKVLLILICAFFLALCGCNSDKKDTAEEVAYDFISSFQNQNFERMYTLTNDMSPYLSNVYNPDEKLNVKLFKALSDNMDYYITKTEIKGENANVFYHLRTLDSEKLMAGIIEDITKNPNDDINEVFDRQVVLCPRIEKDTVLNMDRVGESWVIESNVGIYDDLCGGFLTFSYKAGSVN
ncbi:MAG: hypothetical protein ACI4VF_08955 [Lachnospirales bacterium]